VSLLTENGDTKDDLRLPTDEQLLTQVELLLTQNFCAPMYVLQPMACCIVETICLMIDVS
jgi:hypothetical protein